MSVRVAHAAPGDVGRVLESPLLSHWPYEFPESSAVLVRLAAFLPVEGPDGYSKVLVMTTVTPPVSSEELPRP